MQLTRVPESTHASPEGLGRQKFLRVSRFYYRALRAANTLPAMKPLFLFIVVTLFAAIGYAQTQGAKTVVLEKNEGEIRMRRPLGSLPIPSDEFILKVTPQNSGSKHLVLGTEEIPPGGAIPRHKHLEQDEILLIQTGTAHVTLNDKEYDVHANSEPVLTKVTLSLRRSHRQQTNSVRTYVRVPGIKRRLAFYTHFR